MGRGLGTVCWEAPTGAATGSGPPMQVVTEVASRPAAAPAAASRAGASRPPGQTRVPSSLSLVVQRGDIHSRTTPTNPAEERDHDPAEKQEQHRGHFQGAGPARLGGGAAG